jgi:phosphatidylinositol alpha-1,6-mannosyltransferase
MHTSRKVLFTFDYPPIDGGISRLCEAIGNGLTKDDLVITLQADQQLPIHKKTPHVFIPKLGRLQHELATIKTLRKYIKPNDIVITDIWYLDGFLTLFTKSKKVVILTHGAELFTGKGWFREHLWKRLMSFTLNNAILLLANSAYTEKLTKTVSSNPNIKHLPLGVDEKRFIAKKNYKTTFTKQDPFVIGTLARVHRFKGYETVFDALLKLPDTVREKINYQIAGKGPDLEFLKEVVINKGLSDTVEFIGFVSEEALPKFYQSIDVFVLMTEEQAENRSVEGFGLVFLEAQASGTPVIGANAGGIPDAIEEGNGGWILPTKAHSPLTAKLQELIESTSMIEDMGNKARVRVESSCTWNHYTKAFHALLDKL